MTDVTRAMEKAQEAVARIASNAAAATETEIHEFVALEHLGSAAALSADPKVIEAYLSGDAYLAFAKQAGAAPADTAKATPGLFVPRPAPS
jgi:hypothetical protein